VVCAPAHSETARKHADSRRFHFIDISVVKE
jgi:hypothetical protein